MVVWGSPRCNALGYNGFVNSFSATAELVSTTSYYTFGSGRIAYPGVIQSAFTSNETLSSGSYSLQSPGMTYRFNLLNSSVSGEDINTISLFGMCNMYFNWLVYDQNGKNTRIMHVGPSSAQMYVNGTPITTTISGNNITWTDMPTGISSDSLVSVYLDITFDEFAFSFSIPDGGRLERDIGCTFTGSYLVSPSDREVLVDVQNTLNDLASFLAERFDVDLSTVYWCMSTCTWPTTPERTSCLSFRRTWERPGNSSKFYCTHWRTDHGQRAQYQPNCSERWERLLCGEPQ